MGFDAAATSPLEFTFRPHLDISGVIPDPSEPEVRAFLVRIQRLREEARAEGKNLETDDGDGVIDKANEVAVRIQEQILDATVELCKGTPTREHLAALPSRVQTAFIEWLNEELRNPTKRPATGPPLVAVR